MSLQLADFLLYLAMFETFCILFILFSIVLVSSLSQEEHMLI